MKNAIILGVLSVIIVMVGCGKQPSSNSTKTGDTNTFFLGATTIDGTNVTGTNVSIQVRPRESSK